jgi:transcription termination factor Rho
MRRMLDMLNEEERTDIMIQQLDKADSNEAFLTNLGK